MSENLSSLEQAHIGLFGLPKCLHFINIFFFQITLRLKFLNLSVVFTTGIFFRWAGKEKIRMNFLQRGSIADSVRKDSS